MTIDNLGMKVFELNAEDSGPVRPNWCGLR